MRTRANPNSVSANHSVEAARGTAPPQAATDTSFGEWRPTLPSASDRPLGRFRSSASNQSVAVLADAQEGGQPRQVFAESTGEDDALMVMSTRDDIVAIREQQEAIYRDDDGRIRRHYFDFVITTDAGVRIALAYKPSDRVQALRFEEHLVDLATRISPAFADEIKLITERDFPPAAVFNANLINDCRRDAPNEADAAVLEILRTLTGSVRIADLRDASGHGGEAFRATVRLIARPESHAPLRHPRLRPDHPARRTRGHAQEDDRYGLPVLGLRNRPDRARVVRGLRSGARAPRVSTRPELLHSGDRPGAGPPGDREQRSDPGRRAPQRHLAGTLRSGHPGTRGAGPDQSAVQGLTAGQHDHGGPRCRDAAGRPGPDATRRRAPPGRPEQGWSATGLGCGPNSRTDQVGQTAQDPRGADDLVPFPPVAAHPASLDQGL
jgi:hypothetical protein